MNGSKLFGFSPQQWCEVVKKYPPETADIKGLIGSMKKWNIAAHRAPTGEGIPWKAVQAMTKYMVKPVAAATGRTA